MPISPRLCAAGICLRREIDLLSSRRDKHWDGWQEPAAHHTQNPNSDHEPDPVSDPPGLIRANDMDEDLGGRDGAHPASANRVSARIVGVAETGDPRIKYVICEGRYWSAKTGWKPKTANPLASTRRRITRLRLLGCDRTSFRGTWHGQLARRDRRRTHRHAAVSRRY